MNDSDLLQHSAASHAASFEIKVFLTPLNDITWQDFFTASLFFQNLKVRKAIRPLTLLE